MDSSQYKQLQLLMELYALMKFTKEKDPNKYNEAKECYRLISDIDSSKLFTYQNYFLFLIYIQYQSLLLGF